MKRVRISEFHAHLDACADCARNPYCAIGETIVATVAEHTALWAPKKRGKHVADENHPWRNTKPRGKDDEDTSENDEVSSPDRDGIE